MAIIIRALIMFIFLINECRLEQVINPIIGIVSQELDIYERYYPAYSNYIAASYVKAVEASGARVVPIVINKNKTYYRNILSSVNGVVLPGGGAESGIGNPYYDAITLIYEIATEMNENEEYLPILAICLGFEFLLTIANRHKDIQSKCNIFHENYPIDFVGSYYDSQMYSKLDVDLADILVTQNVTHNNHKWCTSVNDFYESDLPDEWKITATTRSSNDHEFIASYEHRLYPFFAVLFHPEKIAYEWNPSYNIPHSEDAIIANRYFYDTLVYFAKNNENQFTDCNKEMTSLIYNYQPVNSASKTSFNQIYVF